MLPDHDQCCIYFPTILHGFFGSGNDLYTEYTQCKALKEALVTKTASKVKKQLADFDEDGKVDLVLVTHAAGDGKVGGGGRWYTPTQDAASLAHHLVSDIGAKNLQKANVWLWVCEARVNGVALAFRGAIPTSTLKEVYAPSEDIGGVGLFLKHYEVTGADSFALVR